MARQGSTGVIRVWFIAAADALADITTTALGSALDVTPFMRRDGLSTPQSSSNIDASDAASRNNKSIPGNIETGTLTYRGYRDSVTADDDAWTALAQDAAGAFVVRRFGGSAAAAANGQIVEGYVGSVSVRAPQDIGDNAQGFEVTFNYEDYDQEITLA